MNNVNLVGRFTRDPELRYTPNGVAVADFTLAVRNPYKDDGEGADFIRCVVWQKPAELIAESHLQGDMIAISGRLETRSYENDEGMTVFVTEVKVENFTFVKAKNDEGDNTESRYVKGKAKGSNGNGNRNNARNKR